MFPEKLEAEKEREYFGESEYFDGKYKYIHTYLHTNYKYKMHSHEFYEVNIVLGGSGRHYVSDTSLPTQIGDIFVIPPETPHGYYSEDSLDIYHILIKNEFLAKYGEELGALACFNILFDIEPYLRSLSGRNYNLNLGSNLASVKDSLDRINRAESSNQFVYMNALTLALICKICIVLDGILTDRSAEGSADIIKTMDFIKTNLGAKLTLDEISAEANMSKSTLNRRFNDLLGMSPINYLMQCRISRAQELLALGKSSRTEIAQTCGFYDTAHMNKYLKTKE